jgi:hypothetical protein
MPDEFLQETRLVVVASGDHFLQCQGEKGGNPGKKKSTRRKAAVLDQASQLPSTQLAARK